MKIYSILFIAFCFLGFQNLVAQDDLRTITVSGTSEYNLSPNEIILQLTYQEYFVGGEEKKANKKMLEDIESQVMSSISKVGIKKDKITVGGVQIVRPYKNSRYRKPRLNKSLFVCVNNAEELVKLSRSLENDGLLDEAMTNFSISEFRHTDKEAFVTKSRNEAYQDALEKAKLILSESGKKLGSVVHIKEINKNTVTGGSFYSVENTGSSTSGFKPIVITYAIEVVFDIL